MNGLLITVLFMLVVAIIIFAVDVFTEKPPSGYKWDNNEYIDDDYQKLKRKEDK